MPSWDERIRGEAIAEKMETEMRGRPPVMRATTGRNNYVSTDRIHAQFAAACILFDLFQEFDPGETRNWIMRIHRRIIESMVRATPQELNA